MKRQIEICGQPYLLTDGDIVGAFHGTDHGLMIDRGLEPEVAMQVGAQYAALLWEIELEQLKLRNYPDTLKSHFTANPERIRIGHVYFPVISAKTVRAANFEMHDFKLTVRHTRRAIDMAERAANAVSWGWLTFGWEMATGEKYTPDRSRWQVVRGHSPESLPASEMESLAADIAQAHGRIFGEAA